jgi:hypothetical protein
MTSLSPWRLAAGAVGLSAIGACSVTSTGSGGLGAVSVDFSELILEGVLALLVLGGCAFYFLNRQR